MDSWPEVLDEMERRLVDAEVAMAAGEFWFDPVTVPESLGPLPADCRGRARAVYTATLAAESRLSMAMAEVVARMGGRSSSSESRPRPAYVDRRA